MKAQEAREKSEVARKTRNAKREEHLKKPLSIIQKLTLNWIYLRIMRTASKGKNEMLLFFLPDSIIMKKLKEAGYDFKSTGNGLVLHW